MYLMIERHILKHQIPSLAKRGCDLSEHKPKIRFHHANAWFFIVEKSNDFNADEYLVGTGAADLIFASGNQPAVKI